MTIAFLNVKKQFKVNVIINAKDLDLYVFNDEVNETS